MKDNPISVQTSLRSICTPIQPSFIIDVPDEDIRPRGGAAAVDDESSAILEGLVECIDDASTHVDADASMLSGSEQESHSEEDDAGNLSGSDDGGGDKAVWRCEPRLHGRNKAGSSLPGRPPSDAVPHRSASSVFGVVSFRRARSIFSASFVVVRA